MKALLAFAVLMLVSVAAASGTGAPIDVSSAHAHFTALRSLAEPLGLVAVGVGFVLLATQLRGKKC
jgi:NAD-dependent oxidoreductase involved in siderophore biosynthesis